MSIVYLKSYALQWEFFSGLMIYATLASLAYVFQISLNLREEERRARETELRAARAEALHTRAELIGLRAKLNPHFLFNTLHTLTALMRKDHSEAEIAVERFSAMLRYVLRRSSEDGNHERTTTTFADEWEFVENYLALEQLRLGDRLKVEIQIQSDAFDAVLPPLSLQPLVENAIKHAIAPRARGGRISVIVAPVAYDMFNPQSRSYDAQLTKRTDAVRVHNLKVLLKYRARVAFGSDRYGDTPVEDVMYLQQLKVFSNLELLKHWCESTPQMIFPNRRIGRLQDGYEASFQVLAGNPLSDFSQIKNIRIRFKQGSFLNLSPQ